MNDDRSTFNNIKTRIILSLAVNLALVVMGSIGCYLESLKHGISVVRFFTFLSNFVGVISAAFLCAALIMSLKNRSYLISRTAATLKFVSTCCLTLTFLVVVFALVPLAVGRQSTIGETISRFLFTGNMLYQHFLCPVVSIISIIFIDPLNFGFAKARKLALYATCPVLAYAIVVTLLNVLKVMRGPYPFLDVYAQPVYVSILWAVAILGGTYLISFLLAKSVRPRR